MKRSADQKSHDVKRGKPGKKRRQQQIHGYAYRTHQHRQTRADAISQLADIDCKQHRA